MCILQAPPFPLSYAALPTPSPNMTFVNLPPFIFFCSKLAREHSLCKFLGQAKYFPRNLLGNDLVTTPLMQPSQSFSCTNTHTGDPSTTPAQLCSGMEHLTALHLVQQLRKRRLGQLHLPPKWKLRSENYSLPTVLP